MTDNHIRHHLPVTTDDGDFYVYAEEVDGKIILPVHLTYSDELAGTATLAWMKENLPYHIFHGVDDA